MIWPAVGRTYRDLVAEVLGRMPTGVSMDRPIALPDPGSVREHAPLRDRV